MAESWTRLPGPGIDRLKTVLLDHNSLGYRIGEKNRHPLHLRQFNRDNFATSTSCGLHIDSPRDWVIVSFPDRGTREEICTICLIEAFELWHSDEHLAQLGAPPVEGATGYKIYSGSITPEGAVAKEEDNVFDIPVAKFHVGETVLMQGFHHNLTVSGCHYVKGRGIVYNFAGEVNRGVEAGESLLSTPAWITELKELNTGARAPWGAEDVQAAVDRGEVTSRKPGSFANHKREEAQGDPIMYSAEMVLKLIGPLIAALKGKE